MQPNLRAPEREFARSTDAGSVEILCDRHARVCATGWKPCEKKIAGRSSRCVERIGNPFYGGNSFLQKSLEFLPQPAEDMGLGGIDRADAHPELRRDLPCRDAVHHMPVERLPLAR